MGKLYRGLGVWAGKFGWSQGMPQPPQGPSCYSFKCYLSDKTFGEVKKYTLGVKWDEANFGCDFFLQCLMCCFCNAECWKVVEKKSLNSSANLPQL